MKRIFNEKYEKMVAAYFNELTCMAVGTEENHENHKSR